MNKMLLVAKREYLKTVKKPTFWITTLLLPAFIIIVSLISGSSASSVENKVEELANNAQEIMILDESGLINQEIYSQFYEFVDDKESAISQVKSGEKALLIHYKQDLLGESPIEIFAQDQGLLGNEGYGQIANQTLNQSILGELGDETKIAIFNSDLAVETTVFKDGKEQPTQWEQFIVPAVSVGLYFMLVLFSSSYLLQSVSEEKENRMIEIMLSNMTPRHLIWGKILGQIAIVLTQLVVLTTFALVGLAYLINNGTIALDLSGIEISFVQIVMGVFYLFTGFLIMATTMVAVSSAMPSFREASQFSSIFIVLAMCPVYFATSIIFEPSGTLAIATSYFPYTAPMILLFRNALGELSALEVIISSIALVTYVIIGLILSFKVFEFGSLQYSNRISFSDFTKSLRGNGKKS